MTQGLRAALLHARKPSRTEDSWAPLPATEKPPLDILIPRSITNPPLLLWHGPFVLYQQNIFREYFQALQQVDTTKSGTLTLLQLDKLEGKLGPFTVTTEDFRALDSNETGQLPFSVITGSLWPDVPFPLPAFCLTLPTLPTTLPRYHFLFLFLHPSQVLRFP